MAVSAPGGGYDSPPPSSVNLCLDSLMGRVCRLQYHRDMSQALCPVPSVFLTPLDPTGPASVSGPALPPSCLPLRCYLRRRVSPEVAWPTSTSSTRTCCPSSAATTCSWKRRTPMSGLSRAGPLAARPVEEVSAVGGPTVPCGGEQTRDSGWGSQEEASPFEVGSCLSVSLMISHAWKPF